MQQFLRIQRKKWNERRKKCTYQLQIEVAQYRPKRLQVFSEQCSPKSGNSISEK